VFYTAVLCQGVTNPVSLHSFSPPWLSDFSLDRSNWSCPSLSNTTFWNTPAISDLLFEVSELRHYKKLCSKCSTLLISFLNLSQIYWWKVPSPVECYICQGSPGFNFTYSPCSICHHVTQVVEIFHILQLFSMYHNLNGRYCLYLSFLIFFTHFHFYSLTSSKYKESISHFLYHRIFLSKQCEVICVFHSANYLSCCF
jgi:hypothetical protein